MAKLLAQAIPAGKEKETIGVRAYPLPEMRKIVEQLAAKYPTSLYLKPLSELDDAHKPAIAVYLRKFGPIVEGLKDFDYQYPTAGSSEGIYHLLAEIKKNEKDPFIYTLKGEYEGYKEYGKALGIRVIEVSGVSEAREKGYWFISNPSARDGNYLPSDFVQKVCEAGHKVVLDLTYLGSAPLKKLDVSHPNIIAVLTSMSKPFGMFYHRMGFTFVREAIDSLYGNKWFKNLFSLEIAKSVLEGLAPGKVLAKYKGWQLAAVSFLKEKTGLPLVASDVFLIAKLDTGKATEKQLESVSAWKRGDGYRICLTPLFMEMEKNGGVLHD